MFNVLDHCRQILQDAGLPDGVINYPFTESLTKMGHFIAWIVQKSHRNYLKKKNNKKTFFNFANFEKCATRAEGTNSG